VEIPCMGHCVWKHEIDSKDLGSNDEGDLYLLGNGEVIEVGVSTSGPSGKMEMYKEYWTNVEMNGDVSCVVARTEQGTGQEKEIGMVIRVGRHCQAIFQKQIVSAEGHLRVGEVQVERWYKGEKSAVWAKDWRSSAGDDKGEDVVMPSKWVYEEGRKMGDVIELSGRRWEVVECT
jgi:Protein HRI1